MLQCCTINLLIKPIRWKLSIILQIIDFYAQHNLFISYTYSTWCLKCHKSRAWNGTPRQLTVIYKYVWSVLLNYAIVSQNLLQDGIEISKFYLKVRCFNFLKFEGIINNFLIQNLNLIGSIWIYFKSFFNAKLKYLKLHLDAFRKFFKKALNETFLLCFL